MTEAASGADLGTQRTAMLKSIALSFPVAIALWLAVYFLLPAIAGMEDLLPRLVLALKCCCIAVLFCFATGIEAVAHERLVSPAIDPLAGYQTRRLRVNQRYLQHTLEQLLLFIPGLIGLAIYAADGTAMRAVVATTVVWMVFRAIFWIGYHHHSLHRAIGAPGMAQSLLVLLYVSARVGDDIAGTPGLVGVIASFAGIEALLFFATRDVAR